MRKDAAWSTSGVGVALQNRAGRLGAWVAEYGVLPDGFFGVVVCWWPRARAWLSLLALRLRGGLS